MNKRMAMLAAGLMAIAAAAAAAALPVRAVAQEDVAAFYRGKTLRIVVGVAVGSGYDINARLLARHLGAHLPGNPTIIAEPAGRRQPDDDEPALRRRPVRRHGHRRLVQRNSHHAAAAAGRCALRSGEAQLHRLDQPRDAGHLCVAHRAGAKTRRPRHHRNHRRRPGAGSTQYDFPVLANHVFGYKFKVITGYESTPKIHLAMERGEIHGNGATNWSTLKALNSSWIEEKKVRVLAQWALKKHPELPDVPLILDVAKTDADREALKLVVARLEYGRPFFMPPNVPPERVAAVRRAFDATMKDPAYLADADKLKIDVDPLNGEEVAAVVDQVTRTPGETVARVRTALEHR